MTEVLARGSVTSRRVTSTSRIPSSAVWPGQLAALAGAERLPTASVARTNASAVANARLRNRVGDGRGVGRGGRSSRYGDHQARPPGLGDRPRRVRRREVGGGHGGRPVLIQVATVVDDADVIELAGGRAGTDVGLQGDRRGSNDAQRAAFLWPFRDASSPPCRQVESGPLHRGCGVTPRGWTTGVEPGGAKAFPPPSNRIGRFSRSRRTVRLARAARAGGARAGQGRCRCGRLEQTARSWTARMRTPASIRSCAEGRGTGLHGIATAATTSSLVTSRRRS